MNTKYTLREHNMKNEQWKSFINSSELILLYKDKIKIWCIFLDWIVLNLAGSKSKIKKTQKGKFRRTPN